MYIYVLCIIFSIEKEQEGISVTIHFHGRRSRSTRSKLDMPTDMCPKQHATCTSHYSCKLILLIKKEYYITTGSKKHKIV